MYGRMPIGMGNALMRFHREKDEVLGDILGEDYWRGRSPLDAYPLPEPDLDCPKFNALHDAYVKEKEKAPLPPK